MHAETRDLLERYFDAHNRQDAEAVLGMLAEDVAHDVNPGQREVGRSAYARFMQRWNTCYREHYFDIEIMLNADGTRAAAEYTTLGVYLSGAGEGAPDSGGQTYRLRAGTFFEVGEGRIQRLSHCHILRQWQDQTRGLEDPATRAAGGFPETQQDDDVPEPHDRTAGR